MRGRVSLFGILVLGLLGTVGCQSQCMNCRTGGMTPHQTLIGSTSACGGCGLASCADCGTGCDQCGGTSCGHTGYARGPFDHLRKLGLGVVCGDGCGDIYWGEWISDPPDCCDPCGPYGMWTGSRVGCPPKRGIPMVWNLLSGYRHSDGVGCTAASPEMMEYYPTPMEGGQEYNEASPSVRPPSPMPEEAASIPARSRSTIRRVSATAPVTTTPANAKRKNTLGTISQRQSTTSSQAVGTGVKPAGYYRR